MKQISLFFLGLFFSFVLKAEITPEINVAAGNETSDAPYQIAIPTQHRLLSAASQYWDDSSLLTDEITEEKRLKNTKPLINIKDDAFAATLESDTFNVAFSSDDNGSISGETSQRIIYNGTTSAVTAVGNIGYSFVKWINDAGDSITNINPLQIIVTTDTVLTAVFKENKYTIRVQAGQNGTITLLGDSIVCELDTLECAITPDNGYIVSKVYLDDIQIPYEGKYTIVAPDTSHTLKAEFEKFDGMLTLNPAKDAQIYYNSTFSGRANTNYGTLSSLLISYQSSYSNEWQSLIHFSNIQEVLEYSNITEVIDAIAGIKLNLYHNPNVNHIGDNNAFNLYWYNEDWEENEVTWNNAPELENNASYIAISASTTNTQDYSIDITDLFWSEYQQSEGEAGFRLKFKNTSSTKKVAFCSKENDVEYFPEVKIYFKDYFQSVTFTSDENGVISGDTHQFVKKGDNTTAITAISTNSDYGFSEWQNTNGDSISDENPLVITITQDTNLIAVFKPKYTAKFITKANGTVSGEAEQEVTEGKLSSAVTAVGNTGYSFIKWENNAGDSISNINPLQIVVTTDTVLTAVFKKNKYTIRYQAGQNGTITLLGDSIVCELDTLECAITPDNGYIVSKVYLDGIQVPYEGKYTFVAPDASHTLKAEFEKFDGMLTLNPAKDAYIYYNSSRSSRANTNYGTLNSLLISYQSSYKNEWQSLIHFSNIQEVLEYSNITEVTDAIAGIKLNLYHNPNVNHIGDNNAFNLYWYNEDWEENEVTWNNAPELENNASYIAISASTTNTQDYSIDITDLFWSEYQQSEGEAGFRLKFKNTSSTKKVAFCSKENDVEYFPEVKIYFKDYFQSVTFTSDENGTISGDTQQFVKKGDNTTAVTAVPNTGYEFSEWQNAAGNTISSFNPFIFSDISRDTTIYAVFETASDGIKTTNNDSHLAVSPNPTNGNISISLGNMTNTNLTIYNQTGIMVYNIPVFNGGNIDLSALPNGLYIIKINTNKNVLIEEIIKK